MSVSMEMNWNYWIFCLQTLNEYSRSRQMLDVPDGIIGLAPGALAWMIKIPSSELEVNLDPLLGWRLASLTKWMRRNPNYASFEGMLLNKDKTVLYAVPLEEDGYRTGTVTYAEISQKRD